MPISGSIYRQPPIQIPSPAEFLKGITDIREAERKERAATQAEQDEATVRQVLSSTGGDVDATIKKLREVGAWGAADALEKSDTARRKSRADILKTQLENKTASDATVSGYVYAALDDPTPETVNRLRSQLATVPMSPDDPPDSRAKLLDQLATFDPVETPKLLQSWADGLLTEKQQDEKNRAHFEMLHGKDPIKGMAGLLANTTDPQDYAEEYGALLSTVHDRDARALIQATFPDPSQVTPEMFADIQQRLANTGVTEQEKINRMNAETQAANAAADNARADQQLQVSQGQLDVARGNLALRGREASQTAGQDVQGALSPAALEIAAEQYFTTGQLPPLGMGAKASATRTQIMNRAGELHPGAKLAFNSAEYAANKATLNQLTKQLTAVTAFEDTGLKNLKLFTDAAAKIPDTGVPWLNVPIRAVSANLAGSENMAAVNAARQVALTEISRVVSNPNLTGVLSDSARQEVLGLIPESATFAQIKRVASVLEQDMRNRRTSIETQKKDIERKLGGPSNESGGKVRVQGKDGKTYEFPSQAQADAFKKAGG